MRLVAPLWNQLCDIIEYIYSGANITFRGAGVGETTIAGGKVVTISPPKPNCLVQITGVNTGIATTPGTYLATSYPISGPLANPLDVVPTSGGSPALAVNIAENASPAGWRLWDQTNSAPIAPGLFLGYLDGTLASDNATPNALINSAPVDVMIVLMGANSGLATTPGTYLANAWNPATFTPGSTLAVGIGTGPAYAVLAINEAEDGNAQTGNGGWRLWDFPAGGPMPISTGIYNGYSLGTFASDGVTPIVYFRGEYPQVESFVLTGGYNAGPPGFYVASRKLVDGSLETGWTLFNLCDSTAGVYGTLGAMCVALTETVQGTIISWEDKAANFGIPGVTMTPLAGSGLPVISPLRNILSNQAGDWWTVSCPSVPGGVPTLTVKHGPGDGVTAATLGCVGAGGSYGTQTLTFDRWGHLIQIAGPGGPIWTKSNVLPT